MCRQSPHCPFGYFHNEREVYEGFVLCQSCAGERYYGIAVAENGRFPAPKLAQKQNDRKHVILTADNYRLLPRDNIPPLYLRP